MLLTTEFECHDGLRSSGTLRTGRVLCSLGTIGGRWWNDGSQLAGYDKWEMVKPGLAAHWALLVGNDEKMACSLLGMLGERWGNEGLQLAGHDKWDMVKRRLAAFWP